MHGGQRVSLKYHCRSLSNLACPRRLKGSSRPRSTVDTPWLRGEMICPISYVPYFTSALKLLTRPQAASSSGFSWDPRLRLPLPRGRMRGRRRKAMRSLFQQSWVSYRSFVATYPPFYGNRWYFHSLCFSA